MDRRTFLATGVAAAAQTLPAQSGKPSSLLDVNTRRLVSRGDLVYDKPASRSEEGMPIGNGRMGSLVWTTPSELRFQINRADVYPISSASNSFNERNNDFCAGCGYVDIDFAGSAEDVFPENGFEQHLSIYDAVLRIQGRGIKCELLAWPARDVMTVSIHDERAVPQPVLVNLRMLRYESKYFGPQTDSQVNIVQRGSHTSTSRLTVKGSHIVLTQDFREGQHCCKSAVAIALAGRDARPGFAGDSTLRLAVTPGRGTFTVLIASAATFDPNEDVVAAALAQLEAALSKGVSALASETADWWRNFWGRGFVHLHSADGIADYIEQNYNYFLYLMASTSRGKFPPKFNGMLWNTGGDLRTWGAQHWYANLSCYYEALPAANHYELMDPVFDMYFGAHQACSIAAAQQWGSQGSYIPETIYFDGLEKLPDDIAAEMRELYLMRKPWDQRSRKFMEYSQLKHPHSSRWNWIAKGEWVNGRYIETERGSGPFGNVSHILGTSAKIPYLYWRRYEYTLDREWLRDRAYPMLKSAAEFYRNFPNFRKGSDGKYHIYFVNSNESVWGGTDTDEDLCAIRGVFAAAVRAAGILQQDAEISAKWKEVLDNLAPLPASDQPNALISADYKGPVVWVRSLKPVVKPGGMLPDGNSLPAWFFDLCDQNLAVANHTLDAMLRGQPGPTTAVGLLSKVPMAAAAQGRSEAVRYLIPNQMRGVVGSRATPGRPTGVLRNRMSLREGPQALDAEALGRASEAVHLALLQSNPPGPAQDPVIRLFPAWPKGWDAAFTLLARGAFLVTSSIRSEQVEFVELTSQAGAQCRLRNPWGESAVTLYRKGNRGETLQGSLLRFDTSKGERIIVVRGSTAPEQYRRAVLEL